MSSPTPDQEEMKSLPQIAPTTSSSSQPLVSTVTAALAAKNQLLSKSSKTTSSLHHPASSPLTALGSSSRQRSFSSYGNKNTVGNAAVHHGNKRGLAHAGGSSSSLLASSASDVFLGDGAAFGANVQSAVFEKNNNNNNNNNKDKDSPPAAVNSNIDQQPEDVFVVGTLIDDLTDDQVIQMTVLSRVVERYRFLIPSERVDDEVNEASLKWMLDLDAPVPGAAPPPKGQGILKRAMSALSLSRAASGSSFESPTPTKNDSEKKDVDDHDDVNVNDGKKKCDNKDDGKCSEAGVDKKNNEADKSITITTTSTGLNNSEKKIDLDDLARTESGATTTTTTTTTTTVSNNLTANPSVASSAVMTNNNNNNNNTSMSVSSIRSGMLSPAASRILADFDDESDEDAPPAPPVKSSGGINVTTTTFATPLLVSKLKKRRKKKDRPDDDDDHDDDRDHDHDVDTEKNAQQASKQVRFAQTSQPDSDNNDDDNSSSDDEDAPPPLEITTSRAAAAFLNSPTTTTSTSTSSNNSPRPAPRPTRRPVGSLWALLREKLLGDNAEEERRRAHEYLQRQEEEEDSSGSGGGKDLLDVPLLAGDGSNNDDNNSDASAIAAIRKRGKSKKQDGVKNIGTAGIDALKIFGNVTIGAVKGLRKNIKDNVKDFTNDVRSIAEDLGIVDKPDDDEMFDRAQLAKELWARVKGIEKSTTFRHLLEFDNPHFPYTTEKQRETIRDFEDRGELIARDELASELGIESDHLILQSLFGDLMELPNIVFSRLVSCVHEHPFKHSFAWSCAQKAVEAKKNMSLMFSYAIMFLITIVIIPQLDIPSMFLVQRTAWDTDTGEMANGCPSGDPTSPDCFMIKKTYQTVRTRHDVNRYMREYIVTELWPEDESVRASDELFFGNVRVGAMILKVSPVLDSTSRASRAAPNADCPVRSCASLNLSQPTYEFTVSRTFSCEAFDFANSTVIVPFSTTRSQALALTRSWNPVYCEEEESVATLNYALYQPGQQIVLWSTISFTVMKGGSVIPRTFAGTMNLGAKTLIRVFAGCHLSIFFWLLLIVIFRRHEGARRFFTMQMVSEYFLAVLNVISLALIERLPTIEEILPQIVQASHVPPNMDQYVATYSTAMDMLAWWVLVFFVMAAQVFRDVIGLSVITHLLRVTAADVAVLLVLFSMIASTFIGVARCLFGFSTATFSFTPTTIVFLMRFLWGSYGFEEVSAQNPVAGVIFFFAYLAFIIIFVLNLLIAVITSRLEDMRERANLHHEVRAMMVKDAANFEDNERVWFGLRQAMIPLINLVVDALPFLTATLRWKQFNRVLGVLFSPMKRRERTDTPHALVRAACELCDFCAEVSPEKLPVEQRWRTALRRAITTYDVIDDRVSWLLVERCLYAQSSWNVVRDAATIFVLIAYDEDSTDIERIIDYQAEQEQTCVRQREQAASGASEAHERFAKKMSETKKFRHGDAAVLGATSKKAMRRKKLQQQQEDRKRMNMSSSSTTIMTTPATTVINNNGSPPTLPTPSQSVSDPSALHNNITYSRRSSRSSSMAKVAAVTATGVAATPSPTSSNYSVTAKELRYLVNQYLVRLVKSHLYFPIKSAVVLALYCGFFFSLLLYSESSTWLADNLVQGLVQYPYVNHCDEKNCTSGLMWDKKFTDVGQVEDVGQYIEKLFIPKIFPDELPYEMPPQYVDEQANGTSFAVWWDPSVRRSGPVTVRQVTAIQQPCQLPPESALQQYNDSKRTESLTTLKCYKGSTPGILGQFSEQPLRNFDDYYDDDNGSIIDENLGVFPRSAYLHQNTCPEGQVVIGSHDYYGCAGFLAEVHNKTQMQAVYDWFDASARLIVISANFESRYDRGLSEQWAGRTLRVRIALYVEMAAGGGGANVWHYVTVSDQPMFQFAWVGFVLLGLDISFYFIHLVRFVIYTFTRTNDAAGVEQHRPDVPKMSLLALVACVWLASVSSIQRQLAESWMLALLVVSSTAMVMQDFVFPLAKIITHRATYLIRALTLAVRLVIIIIPFYVVCSTGFVFSSHILFGRNVMAYSSMRLALQTVGRGLLSDLAHFDEMFQQRPLQTVLFCVAFFAVVLVVLANLMLTLITAAVDEAKRETKIVNFIQMAAEFAGHTVYCDEFVATYLAWHLAENHIVRRVLRSAKQKIAELFGMKKQQHNTSGGAAVSSTTTTAKGDETTTTHHHHHHHHQSAALRASERELRAVRRYDEIGGQFLVTANGRFCRPLESVMFVMPFLRLSELSDTLELSGVREDFIYSVALFLARSQQQFQKRFPEQFTLDDAEEARLSYGFRERALR